MVEEASKASLSARGIITSSTRVSASFKTFCRMVRSDAENASSPSLWGSSSADWISLRSEAGRKLSSALMRDQAETRLSEDWEEESPFWRYGRRAVAPDWS